MYISRSCEMQLSGNSPNKGVAINGIAIAISNIAYSEGREQLINNLIGGFLSPGQGGSDMKFVTSSTSSASVKKIWPG